MVAGQFPWFFLSLCLFCNYDYILTSHLFIHPPMHPSLNSICDKSLCLLISSPPFILLFFFCGDCSQVGWLTQLCFISSGPSVRPSLWTEERMMEGRDREGESMRLDALREVDKVVQDGNSFQSELLTKCNDFAFWMSFLSRISTLGSKLLQLTARVSSKFFKIKSFQFLLCFQFFNSFSA